MSTPICDLPGDTLFTATDTMDNSTWLLWWDDDTLVSIRMKPPLEILAWDGGIVRSLEENNEHPYENPLPWRDGEPIRINTK